MLCQRQRSVCALSLPLLDYSTLVSRQQSSEVRQYWTVATKLLTCSLSRVPFVLAALCDPYKQCPVSDELHGCVQAEVQWSLLEHTQTCPSSYGYSFPAFTNSGFISPVASFLPYACLKACILLCGAGYEGELPVELSTHHVV